MKPVSSHSTPRPLSCWTQTCWSSSQSANAPLTSTCYIILPSEGGFLQTSGLEFKVQSSDSTSGLSNVTVLGFNISFTLVIELRNGHLIKISCQAHHVFCSVVCYSVCNVFVPCGCRLVGRNATECIGNQCLLGLHLG